MTPTLTGAELDRLHAELQSDETLLWSGKPETSYLSSELFKYYLFGAAFTAFATFFFSQRPAPKQLEEVLFISIFYMAGLGIMIIAPVFHIRHRKRWIYALTTRRALLLLHNGTREYPLERYMVLKASTPAHRPGYLVFEREEVGSGKERHVVEWGFANCLGADEALRIMEDQLGGYALESSKTEEVRQQERDEAAMQFARRPAILPLLNIAIAGLTCGILICASYMYDSWQELVIKSFSSTFDTLVAPAFIIILMLIGLISSITARRTYLRGRKLLRQATQDTPE